MNWTLLWKFTLIFTLCSYASLVIIVIIGGLKNIVEMLKELSAPRDEQ